MIEAIKKIISFSGQEKKKIYRAIILSFFRSLFSMFRMAAIYYILLAFEEGSHTMKPAWTALAFLGVSITGQFILKKAADLQAVHAGYYMKCHTTEELEKALTAAGFTDIRTDHHTSKPWITVLARKA